MNIMGHVSNIETVYRRAPFSINITLMGSGTKTKINESISYHVACISFDISSKSSMLEHGVNGLIAETEE